jgi:hypothetical protein
MPPCSFDLEKTQDHEKKMELYDRLFVAFNNALQAIRDDMNDLVPLSLSLSISLCKSLSVTLHNTVTVWAEFCSRGRV